MEIRCDGAGTAGELERVVEAEVDDEGGSSSERWRMVWAFACFRSFSMAAIGS